MKKLILIVMCSLNVAMLANTYEDEFPCEKELINQINEVPYRWICSGGGHIWIPDRLNPDRINFPASCRYSDDHKKGDLKRHVEITRLFRPNEAEKCVQNNCNYFDQEKGCMAVSSGWTPKDGRIPKSRELNFDTKKEHSLEDMKLGERYSFGSYQPKVYRVDSIEYDREVGLRVVNFVSDWSFDSLFLIIKNWNRYDYTAFGTMGAISLIGMYAIKQVWLGKI